VAEFFNGSCADQCCYQALLRSFKVYDLGIVAVQQGENAVLLREVESNFQGHLQLPPHNLGLLQAHLRRFFIGADQTADAQFYTAEITHRYQKDVRHIMRQQLIVDRQARAAIGFAVVVGAVLLTVCAQPIRITMVVGFGVKIAQVCQAIFYFGLVAHGVGKV